MLQTLMLNHKLLITIIKKGLAKKVIKVTKEAGAEGGTVILGRGTVKQGQQSFLGLEIEPEKEIVLTLVPDEKIIQVMGSAEKVCQFKKPDSGIALVINIKSAAGICHLCPGGTIVADPWRRVEMAEKKAYDLIVTIVNKGSSEKVVEASKKSGAEGGTILFGRGTGIHEQAKLFGIPIEPEKELVLTLISQEKTSEVLESIVQEAKLHKPGKGIAFVLPVEQVAGISRA